MNTVLVARCAVVGSMCLFGFGLSLPVIVVAHFHLWPSTYSVFGIVVSLLRDQQHFFAVCIGVLAIAVPLVKLYLLFVLAFVPAPALVQRTTTLQVLGWCASWAMLGVLVFALLVFMSKNRAAYSPSLLPGLVCLVGCVVCMFVADIATHMPHMPAQQHTRASVITWSVATVACIGFGSYMLAWGIRLPIVRFSVPYLGLLEQQYSIVSLATALYEKDERFLYWVVVVFSILFPGAKIVFLAICVSFRRYLVGETRLVAVVEWFGRYSMTDIMVVGLMVFFVKRGGYTDSVTLAGTYYFAASVCITMLGYAAAHVLLRSR